MSKTVAPEQGEGPTKRRTSQPNQRSAEEQRLLDQYAGQITHFHAAARQQRQISEQPGFSMNGRLPNGGRMRYSWNNGQEMLTVDVVPPKPKRVPPPQPPRPGTVVVPFLAIDVLFEADPYLTGDVYGSNAPPGYNEPGYWTPERMEAATNTFYSPSRVVAYFRTNPLYQNPRCTLIKTGFWAGYWRGDEEMFDNYPQYTGPYYPYLSVPTAGAQNGDQSSYHPAAPPIDTSNPVAPWTKYMVVRIQYTIPAGASGTDQPLDVDYLDTMVIGHGLFQSASGSRETYEYLDTIVPVGIVGGINPTRPDLEFGALTILPPDVETGEMVGHPTRRDDNRLRALGENWSKEAEDRELLFLDPSHMGYVGAGFTAVPVMDPSVSGASGQKCVYDIYIATENLNKHNPPPGNADSGGWDNDSPDMEYGVGDIRDGPTTIEWKIRAREFNSSTPISVKVRTWTERRRRLWGESPPSGGEGGSEGPGGPGGGGLVITPGGVPDGDGGWYIQDEDISGGIPETTPPAEGEPPPPPPQPLPGDRMVTWYFAADREWEDKGGEPADPNNEKPPEGDKPAKPLMGKLLAELAGSTEPEGPPADEIEANREHEVRQQSIWDKDVEPDPDAPTPVIAEAIKAKMTKIARLTWFPPSEPGLDGKVEIVPA